MEFDSPGVTSPGAFEDIYSRFRVKVRCRSGFRGLLRWLEKGLVVGAGAPTAAAATLSGPPSAPQLACTAGLDECTVCTTLHLVLCGAGGAPGGMLPLYMFTPWLEDSLKAANPDTLKVCVRTAGGGRQCRPWSGCPVRTGCTPAFKGHASTLSDLRCCSTATWTSGVSC